MKDCYFSSRLKKKEKKKESKKLAVEWDIQLAGAGSGTTIGHVPAG
jgi:hypothetical protein